MTNSENSSTNTPIQIALKKLLFGMMNKYGIDQKFKFAMPMLETHINKMSVTDVRNIADMCQSFIDELKIACDENDNKIERISDDYS